jgi:ribosomal protein L7/L12
LLPPGIFKPEDADNSLPLAPSTPDQAQELLRVIALAQSGKKIEAIRLFREVFDTSLAEGKLTVEAIIAGEPVTLPDGKRHAPSAPSRTGLLEEIARLHRNGSPIAAIKLFRETYGTGLGESQDAVKRLASGRMVTLPDGSVYQQAEGFSTINLNPDAPEMINRLRATGYTGTSCGTRLGIIAAVCGIIIGFAGAIAGILVSLPENQQPAWLKNLKPQPEALVAPFLSITASPTPTSLPFASPVFTFGGEGTGAGLFSDAREIGVDANGNIYVGDMETRYVQVFDRDGNFRKQWFTGERDDGRDLNILGMAVRLDGRVFIASVDGLYGFDGLTGEHLDKLSIAGNGYFEDVAAAPDGSLLAVYFDSKENIIRFNDSGQVDLLLESPIGNVTDHSELDTRVAVDGIGNIYLLGSFNNLAFIYNRDGKYQNRFGGDGEGPGTFRAVNTLAIDNHSRIYISDFQGIQVFDSSGRYLDTFESSHGVRDMVFDLDGFLYTVDYMQVVTRYQVNK